MASPSQKDINTFVRAAYDGHTETIRKFMRAFPEQADRDALLTNTHTVKGLMFEGIEDAYGYALNWAIYNKRHDAIPLLIEMAGGNPNVINPSRDEFGFRITPLQTAANFAEDRRAVTTLMNAGVPINARDVHGRTAAHNTARDGKVQGSLLLLEHGADPTVRQEGGSARVPDSLRGKTPAQYAQVPYRVSKTSKYAGLVSEFNKTQPQTSALWHAAEVAWTHPKDTAKLDEALDEAQARGVDRGALSTAIAQGLEKAGKAETHASVLAHLKGQTTAPARTAEGDTPAATATTPAPPPSGATAGPKGQTGTLTTQFKRGGYTPLEAKPELSDAANILYLAAEENPERVKLIWYTGTGADRQAHKIAGPNSDHVPVGIQVSDPKLLKELLGDGLAEGRNGIIYHRDLAAAAGYLDQVRAPDAEPAAAAAARAPTADLQTHTARQIIPGPFGANV